MKVVRQPARQVLGRPWCGDSVVFVSVILKRQLVQLFASLSLIPKQLKRVATLSRNEQPFRQAASSNHGY